MCRFYRILLSVILLCSTYHFGASVKAFASSGQGSAPPVLAGAEVLTYRSYDHASTSPVAFESRAYARHSLTGRSYVMTPNGTPPYPVAMVLPGSGGWGSDEQSFKDAFLDAGFAVVAVDPFSPRGLSFTRGLGLDQSGVIPLEYANDVMAAAQAISIRPDLDSARMVTYGHSMGAGAQIFLASQWWKNRMPVSNARGIDFAGHIMAAPACWYREAAPRPTNAKVALLLGARDNWNLPWKCRDWAQRHAAGGGDVDVIEFPQGHHGFVRGGGVETIRPTVFQCLDVVFDMDSMTVSNSDGSVTKPISGGGYGEFVKETVTNRQGCSSADNPYGFKATVTMGGTEAQKQRALHVVLDKALDFVSGAH